MSKDVEGYTNTFLQLYENPGTGIGCFKIEIRSVPRILTTPNLFQNRYVTYNLFVKVNGTWIKWIHTDRSGFGHNGEDAGVGLFASRKFYPGEKASVYLAVEVI
jgi:hypothetical protein